VWKTIKFKTATSRDNWISRHKANYQIVEVFINNGYALDVRRLKLKFNEKTQEYY
jgi:hypothetical protein